jgi:hypothetical protein
VVEQQQLFTTDFENVPPVVLRRRVISKERLISGGSVVDL